MAFPLVILIVFINTALLTLLGMLMSIGPAGMWPLVSILIHFAIYLLSDKICLALSKARRSHETIALEQKLQNCTYQLGLPGVDVYVSRRLLDNLYLFQGGVGRPSIVIGTSVLKHLGVEEILSLVNVGLLMVKTGDVRTRNFLSVSQMILAFPSWLKDKFAGKKWISTPLWPFIVAMDVYALPINALYEAYIRRRSKVRSHELLASKIFDQQATIYAAKQKISALGDSHGPTNWMALVERMSLVKKKTSTLAGMVFARGEAHASAVGAK